MQCTCGGTLKPLQAHPTNPHLLQCFRCDMVFIHDASTGLYRAHITEEWNVIPRKGWANTEPYQWSSVEIEPNIKWMYRWLVPDMEAPAPPVKQHRPVIEGSVIGYRAWRINTETWKLQGTGAGHGGDDWEPGITTAKCGKLGAHPAPHEDCHCGLNALARFSDDKRWWAQADTNLWATTVGAIEAWSDETDPRTSQTDNPGRFFLHSTGFRAQYARIVLLAVDDNWPRAKTAAIRALASEYGADICKQEHLADAAKEHGQLVSDKMLKWAHTDDEEYFALPSLSAAATHAYSWHEIIEAFSAVAKPTERALRAYKSIATSPSPAPRKTRGIKKTIGYPGPPQFERSRAGDLVRDSKKRVWECIKSGKPGSWEISGSGFGLH